MMPLLHLKIFRSDKFFDQFFVFLKLSVGGKENQRLIRTLSAYMEHRAFKQMLK